MIIPDPKRLHDETNRLNQALLEFEEELYLHFKLRDDVSVAVDINPGKGWQHRSLVFEKYHGKFRLIVRQINKDNSVTKTPLVNTSRQTRLDAVSYCRTLQDQLSKIFSR